MDGKGSSEDTNKEDQSGEVGSDEASAQEKVGLGLKIPRHEGTADKKSVLEKSISSHHHEHLLDDAKAEGSEGNLEEDSRERKLLDKKRKRIEMRREYEAQQQSESSDNQADCFFRPARPVTLEHVLQFSMIPR
jgi:hypothetical protein